jgi:hypothetical protein
MNRGANLVTLFLARANGVGRVPHRAIA